MTSLRFIRCFRRLLRNHKRLAGFRLNPSTWSRGPTPLSGVQGRLSSAQSRASGAHGRLSGAHGRVNGAHGRLSGAHSRLSKDQSCSIGAQSRLFFRNYSRFLVSRGIAVIHFLAQGQGLAKAATAQLSH